MRVYRFGPFVLDVEERRLLGNGQPVALTPRVFDTLAYLVEHHGHLVGKDELLGAVWAGANVEEGSLARTVHVLRKALGSVGDEADRQRQYIETLPTKGYRFVAEVTRLDQGQSIPTLPIVGPVDLDGRSPTRASRRSRRAWAVALLILGAVGAAWLVMEGRGTPTSAEPRPPTIRTGNGAAYVRYQQGRLHLERHHPGDTDTALQHFDAAISLDPMFADAYAGKADALFFRFWDTGAHDDIAQARGALRRALELHPGSSYAHVLQCRLLTTYDWDFAAAEPECRRAIEIDPRNHEARRELALLLSAIGRRDEALVEADAAIGIAPTSPNKRARGMVLHFDRRFDEAIAQFQQIKVTDPEYVDAGRWIVRALEQARDFDRAFEALVREHASAGASADDIASLRAAFAAGGWREVLRIVRPAGRPQASLDAAGSLAQLGEVDAAFDVLEAMIRARRVMTVHLDSDPRLDPLRSDPRFDQLVRRVGLR